MVMVRNIVFNCVGSASLIHGLHVTTLYILVDSWMYLFVFVCTHNIFSLYNRSKQITMYAHRTRSCLLELDKIIHTTNPRITSHTFPVEIETWANDPITLYKTQQRLHHDPYWLFFLFFSNKYSLAILIWVIYALDFPFLPYCSTLGPYIHRQHLFFATHKTFQFFYVSLVVTTRILGKTLCKFYWKYLSQLISLEPSI
jgi:hypothetical protein